MKRIFWPILMLCLFCSAFCRANPIFLDTRLMLLAHPLFDNFDDKTARFKKTSSEYIEGEQKGLNEHLKKIRKLTRWLMNSPKNLQKELMKVPLPDRIAAERKFMEKKRKIENKLEQMKIRAYNARLVPGRIGVTPDSSITPQINLIGSDIRAVLDILRKKYSTKVVIDVSELLPIEKYNLFSSDLLNRNLHAKFRDNPDSISKNDFQKWLNKGSEYWAQREGIGSNPIPFGAVDVRLEAIKLLEEQTKRFIYEK